MGNDSEIVWHSFDLDADAWEFLYAEGFVARLENHRAFKHPDGREAMLVPGDDDDSTAEVKIFRS